MLALAYPGKTISRQINGYQIWPHLEVVYKLGSSGCFRTACHPRLGQQVNQGGFADIRPTDKADFPLLVDSPVVRVRCGFNKLSHTLSIINYKKPDQVLPDRGNFDNAWGFELEQDSNVCNRDTGGFVNQILNNSNEILWGLVGTLVDKAFIRADDTLNLGPNGAKQNQNSDQGNKS